MKGREKFMNNKDIPMGFTTILVSTVPGITFYIQKMSSKQNSWLAIIIGSILGFLFLKMILYIRSCGNNIFDANKKALGCFSILINILLSLTLFLFSSLIAWHSYIFLKSQYFSETPFLIIALGLIIPVSYLIIRKNATLIRTNTLLFKIILVLIFGAVFLLSFQFNFENLKPFAEIKNNDLLYGIFVYFSVSILPIYSLLSIGNLNDKKKAYKYYFLGCLCNLAASTVTYLDLGKYLVDNVAFPEMYVLRRIGSLTNSARIDSLIISEWIICIFLNVSYSLFYVKNCISYYKSNINKYLYLILPFLLFIVSTNTFKDTSIGKNFISSYYPIISFIVLFGCNFIIFIILKIKKKP